MTEYHKIQTLYLRDPTTKHKTLLEGQFALPEFEYLAPCLWECTEKVDGTNIRVMLDAEGGVTLGGRTDSAQIPAKLVEKLNQRFLTVKRRQLLAETFPGGNVVLYGEGFGAGIQKVGPLYGPEQDFVLFDILVGGHWWLLRENVEEIAEKLQLPIVPVVGTMTIKDAVEFVRAGFSSAWGDFPAEGIVARPTVELRTRKGDRIITKLKVRDFA